MLEYCDIESRNKNERKNVQNENPISTCQHILVLTLPLATGKEENVPEGHCSINEESRYFK